jgi:CHAD domain-containing protein
VAAKPNSTPVQLHAFRLSAKRFRYTLELFESMYGPMLADRLEQVRKIQVVLGERQDCVVLNERLRKRTGGAGPLRDVLAKLSAEGRTLEEKFRRYWRETFDAPGAETRWIRHLERRPVEPGAPRGAIRKNAGANHTTKVSANTARRG